MISPGTGLFIEAPAIVEADFVSMRRELPFRQKTCGWNVCSALRDVLWQKLSESKGNELCQLVEAYTIIWRNTIKIVSKNSGLCCSGPRIAGSL